MTDMRMPTMGGAEFIRQARAKGVRAKIIAITAFQNLANANQLARLQVYCCLIKPVLLTKLEETVTRALEEGDEPAHAPRKPAAQWKSGLEKNARVDPCLFAIMHDGASPQRTKYSLRSLVDCRLREPQRQFEIR